MHATTIPDDLITLNEACGLVPGRTPGKKLHISSMYRWLLSGRLRGWRIGGKWCVSRRGLLALFVPSEPAPDVVSREEWEERQAETWARLEGAGFC